jgi:hypothetical protein
MLKTILNVIFICLLLVGGINIIGSVLVLMDVPFFTRWDDWTKHTDEKSLEMIRDGFVFILLGAIYLKYIAPKFSKNQPKPSQYTKCPNCKEVFNYNELKDGKCKNCKDVDTVDLDEYFKQYPDELIEEDDRKDKN